MMPPAAASPGPGRRRRLSAGRGAVPAAVTLLFVCAALTGCGGRKLTVYAAASLTDVLEDAARAYTSQGGAPVEINPAGSSLLATQILKGAPADVFVSADPAWTDTLQARGRLVPGTTRVLAWNQLSVVVPKDATIRPPNYYLLDKFPKIALGEPTSVPLGKYTRQSLEFFGVWGDVAPHAVFGANAREVLAKVERGEVDGAVVYTTDAESSDRVDILFPLPEGTHDVIVYTGGVVAGTPREAAARAFLDFLSGPQGKTIFRQRGFLGT